MTTPVSLVSLNATEDSNLYFKHDTIDFGDGIMLSIKCIKGTNILLGRNRALNQLVKHQLVFRGSLPCSVNKIAPKPVQTIEISSKHM